MISYIYSFTTYLFRQIDIKRIDKIILYGSAVTGDLKKESDIDIFIDTKEDINAQVKKITEQFYKSKEFLLYKLNNIENKISIKVGELKKWKELHRSISSKGIVLFSLYEPTVLPVGTKHEIIFYWDKIGKNRGAFLNKLYGFTVKGKKYSGLLERWGGKRLGKSCIIIPSDKGEDLIKLLKMYKVNVKKIESFSLD